MVSVFGFGVGEGVGEGVREGEGVDLVGVGNGLGSAQAAQRMRMVRMAKCLLIDQPLSMGKYSLPLSWGLSARALPAAVRPGWILAPSHATVNQED